MSNEQDSLPPDPGTPASSVPPDSPGLPGSAPAPPGPDTTEGTGSRGSDLFAPPGSPGPSGLPDPAGSPDPSSWSRNGWTTLRNAFRKSFGRSEELSVEQQIKRRTIVSFAGFLLLGGAAWKAWFWLKDQPRVQGMGDGVQEPLRKGLNAGEGVFKHTLSPDHLAPVYPKSAAAVRVRPNGDIGLDTKDFDATTWKLQVTTAGKRTLSIGLEELRQLPKTEIVFEFKCIEGWSQISWWGGVKFSDFIRQYHLEKEASLAYVGLSTPDKEYYVGIDRASAMHPQTLLCYEMNGQPLPMKHGQPLRLILPVKYGVKNLKRISNIYFSDERPPDYWYERGYDYYCGL